MEPDYLTERLGEALHRKYIDNRTLAVVFRSQTNSLIARKGAHYVVFSDVAEGQLTGVDRIRDTNYKSLRFLYLNRQQALIVKITPPAIHQAATSSFAFKLQLKSEAMGSPDELLDMRGTRYRGIARSKEGDWVFKPLSFRPCEACWPTLVIECGVSERLDRLTVDAHWWLKDREGGVNIVCLCAISRANQTIHVEKWELASAPGQFSTSSYSDPVLKTPTQTPQIDISNQVSVNGALTLNFAKLYLRPPLPGGLERDILFNPGDLEQWARASWASAK
ncbi:hypothetical protein HOY80DRAFT_1000089 [Tuber brumale]|nr:hypothetical protein HOY80DRAFT_1000089 [Tuber brumale]